MKVLYNEFKAKKGLFRIRIVLSDTNVIEGITITGDFFVYPEYFIWIVEEELKGKIFSPEVVLAVINDIVKKYNVKFVGFELEELVRGIMEAKPVE